MGWCAPKGFVIRSATVLHDNRPVVGRPWIKLGPGFREGTASANTGLDFARRESLEELHGHGARSKAYLLQGMHVDHPTG